MDFLSWLGKTLVAFVIWVFIFSIHIGEKMLFNHAHETLIQNSFIQGIDQELTSLWENINQTTKLTFASPEEDEEEKENSQGTRL